MRHLADRLIRLPASSRRLLRWGRLGVAALCLLLALATALGSARTTSHAAAPPTIGVVVATHDLPAGAVLRSSDLTRAQWPRTVAAALPKVDGELAGRRLAGPILRGEPITPSRLLGGDLTAGLPPGTVAAGLEISGGPQGIIRAGDRIDVIAASAQDTARSAGDPPTVVAVRALVLAATRAGNDLGGVESADAVSVVLATSRPVAIRLAGLAATAEFTAVLDPP